MKVEETLLGAYSRADSYQLLSQCYFPPDQNLLKRLRSLEVTGANAGRELIQYIPAQDSLKLLAVDFSRLFIGPFKLLAPPYGSVYLNGSNELMGSSTVAVRRFYQEQGLEVSLKEVPDHIALELEFVYYLITKEIAAFETKDNQDAANWREKQLLFLSQYLESWVPEFTQVLEKGASLEFYRALAQITRTFIQTDFKQLKPVRS